MDRRLRAVLLSALVFPGAGQAFLGSRRRALCFALPAVAAVTAFALQLMAPVQAIADAVLAGRIAPDPVAILEQVHGLAIGDTLGVQLSAAVMLASWVGSVADAWWQTR